MSNGTIPVGGGAMSSPSPTNHYAGTSKRNAAFILRGGETRSSANALRSKLMIEAHARAREDFAFELTLRGTVHHVNRSYSYYLGLQMRSGFAEARVARTGLAPAFELPPQRWA